MAATGPRPVSRVSGGSLWTSRTAQTKLGPHGAHNSKDTQEGHDLVMMKLARVEEIGGLDEGPIRERADNDARHPENAEDPEWGPPRLHKMENNNADERDRAHRDDRFEDSNSHPGHNAGSPSAHSK